MKPLISLLILLAAAGTSKLGAQEVISSGGSHFSGSGVSLSWTIGEPVIETLTNGSYTLTQGFHQGKLSSTAVDNTPLPGLNMVVYPNPFNSILNIKVDEGDYANLHYSLFSVDGKVLANKKLSNDLTQIDMEKYTSGNYLLRIHKKNGEPLRTFKVVKQ
jgi:hypothetical protein